MGYYYDLTENALGEIKTEYTSFVADITSVLNKMFGEICEVVRETKFKPFSDIGEKISEQYQIECKKLCIENMDNKFVNKALSNVCKYIGAGSKAEETAQELERNIKDIFTDNYSISHDDISSIDTGTPNVSETDFEHCSEIFKKASDELSEILKTYSEKFSREEKNKFKICIKAPLSYQVSVIRNFTDNISDTFIKLKDVYIDIIKASDSAEELYDEELRNDLVSEKVVERYEDMMQESGVKKQTKGGSSGGSSSAAASSDDKLEKSEEKKQEQEVKEELSPEVKKYIDEKNDEILRILKENEKLFKKLAKYSEATEKLMPEKITENKKSKKKSEIKLPKDEIIPIYNVGLYDSKNVENVCRMVLQTKKAIYREVGASDEKASIFHEKSNNILNVITTILSDDYVKLITSFLPDANVKIGAIVASCATKLVSADSVKNFADKLYYKRDINNFKKAYSNPYIGLISKHVIESFYLKKTGDKQYIPKAICPSLLRYMDKVDDKEYGFIESAYIAMWALTNRYIKFNTNDYSVINAMQIKLFKISYKIFKKCSTKEADKATDEFMRFFYDDRPTMAYANLSVDDRSCIQPVFCKEAQKKIYPEIFGG